MTSLILAITPPIAPRTVPIAFAIIGNMNTARNAANNIISFLSDALGLDSIALTARYINSVTNIVAIIRETIKITSELPWNNIVHSLFYFFYRNDLR